MEQETSQVIVMPQRADPVGVGSQLKIELTPCRPKSALDETWKAIGPYVEEIAKQSAGEYDPYYVYLELYSERAVLFMGYLDDPAKTFVGYIILKLDPMSVHLWHVYIVPQYRHTNILDIGAAFIEKEVRKMGAKSMTFSATREWEGMIERIGFKRTFTIYRKELT